MTILASATIDSAADFNASYWQMYILARQHGDLTASGDKVARINGRHYTIGRKKPHTHLELRQAGFGGREFRIRFVSGPHAGQTVVTHNLWSQGAIPDEFRIQLPDNAEFVR